MQELTLLRDKKIARITAVVLGVFLFVTVALLVFQLYLKSKLDSVKAASVEEQRRIQSLTATQTSYALVSKKVKTVAEIFTKRGNKWDAITFFYSILPAGTAINSVEFQSSGDSSQLSFTIQAPTVFLYDQLSTVLQSDQVKRSGYTLELGSLSRGKDGSYRVDVTLKSSTAPAKPPVRSPVPPATP